MHKIISCLRTDRLCIEDDQVELNKDIRVYWPVGLVPQISDLSKLRIFLYQSDLLRLAQSDPCNIREVTPLNSWTPLQIDTQNPDYPLLKSTTITIPATASIQLAMSADNSFFFQIKSVDDKLCSIGPYSIPVGISSFKIISSNALTPSSGSGSSGIKDSGVGDNPQVGNGTSPGQIDPTTETYSSSKDLRGVQTGLGIGISLIGLLILIAAIILRKRVSKTEEDGISKKKFEEDLSKLSVNFESEFSNSAQNLIASELVKSPTDQHQVIVIESENVPEPSNSVHHHSSNV